MNSPSRFSDHLFSMKKDGSLLDPLRQFVSDKEYVKYYIGAVVGWQHTVETYKVLYGPDEIDNLELERFPCVLKPTHASGPVLFMTDPNQPLDRELLKNWFGLDYYKRSREQNYKYLRPKVIVEEFFSADGQTVPRDYKIFCFDGVPKLIQVDSDRYTQMSRILYDNDWNRLPVTIKYIGKPEDDPRPAQLEKMLYIATRLSRHFSFVRVDMYTDGVTVKVGELTHSPGSASVHVIPSSGEFTLGRLFERDQYL